MRPHPRGAETDSSAPRAWSTCERCGFIWNHYKLNWQFEYRGAGLMNTRHIVCEYCLDEPQRQLGTIFLPPDPLPIFNARPEQYSIDEQNFRVTMDGIQRLQLDGVARIQSNVQSGSAFDQSIGTESFIEAIVTADGQDIIFNP